MKNYDVSPKLLRHENKTINFAHIWLMECTLYPDKKGINLKIIAITDRTIHFGINAGDVVLPKGVEDIFVENIINTINLGYSIVDLNHVLKIIISNINEGVLVFDG